MNKFKIYIISILAFSLIISTSGFAEFCSCYHDSNILQEVSNNLDCCKTNATTARGLMSCCSNDELDNSQEKNNRCKDLHNSCMSCNVTMFPLVKNNSTVLTQNIFSFSQFHFAHHQIISFDDETDKSKYSTFLRELQTNNLSNYNGMTLLISIHKLKIPLPALA